MAEQIKLVAARSREREQRADVRRPIVLPGQISWKDARGTIRWAEVRTRDVSQSGVMAECLKGAAIPLYRLVNFQIDRSARGRSDLPRSLRQPQVLAAVYRVGPCEQETGVPTRYALRLLVKPEASAVASSDRSPSALAEWMTA